MHANWLNIVKPKRQEGKEARMSRRPGLTEVHNTSFLYSHKGQESQCLYET